MRCCRVTSSALGSHTKRSSRHTRESWDTDVSDYWPDGPLVDFSRLFVCRDNTVCDPAVLVKLSLAHQSPAVTHSKPSGLSSERRNASYTCSTHSQSCPQPSDRLRHQVAFKHICHPSIRATIFGLGANFRKSVHKERLMSCAGNSFWQPR